MPTINHNAISLVFEMKSLVQEISKLLIRLRQLIITGNFRDIPHSLLKEVSQKTMLLVSLMNKYTIKNEKEKILYRNRKKYETPIEFISNEAHQNPSFAKTDVEWDKDIYLELGFSKKEFEYFIEWKNQLEIGNMDFEKAYEAFIDYVLHDLTKANQKQEYTRKVNVISGAMGFAADVIMFTQILFVPSLVSSTITGLSVMALNSDKIMDTMFGIGGGKIRIL